MRRNLPYPKLYLVEWEDAASNDGWVSPADDTGPELVITIGFLIKETEGYITLANTQHIDADPEHQVGGTMTIPCGMIREKKEVKVSNARSKPRHKVHPEPATKEVHRKPGES